MSSEQTNQLLEQSLQTAERQLKEMKAEIPATPAFMLSMLFTKQVAKSLLARVFEMERELAEIKATRQKFCGVFQRALTYTKGDLVTHGGSLWACVAEQTSATPGTTNGWQLAVKSGDVPR